jgi:phosphopantothenoylcysteine decarboxylase/phosphopantothenate--cysteine ligase
VLGVTGSIAAYKAAALARLLVEAGVDVRTILTPSAERFVGSDTFAALTGNPVQTSLWERPGEVVHVRLAREADAIVAASATADAAEGLAAFVEKRAPVYNQR